MSPEPQAQTVPLGGGGGTAPAMSAQLSGELNEGSTQASTSRIPMPFVVTVAVAVMRRSDNDKPRIDPMVVSLNDVGGSDGGYATGSDIIDAALDSCDKSINLGSMPSLRRRIALPQSPMTVFLHSAESGGVVIEAKVPSIDIQFIMQGIPLSVALVVVYEKRLEEVVFCRVSSKCVGPEIVEESQGRDDEEVERDARRVMSGANITGLVTIEALFHNVVFESPAIATKDDGGKG